MLLRVTEHLSTVDCARQTKYGQRKNGGENTETQSKVNYVEYRTIGRETEKQ